MIMNTTNASGARLGGKVGARHEKRATRVAISALLIIILMVVVWPAIRLGTSASWDSVFLSSPLDLADALDALSYVLALTALALLMREAALLPPGLNRLRTNAGSAHSLGSKPCIGSATGGSTFQSPYS
jgi:Na+-driven multidrug efflux pump